MRRCPYHARFIAIFREPRLVLLACLLINLLWFIGYAPWHNEQERLLYNPPNPDTRSYHTVAITLMNYWNRPGELLDELPSQPEVAHAITNRPLGYPLLLALVYAIFGVHPIIVIIVQLILNVIGCWIAMRAMEILVGSRFAVGGGWLYALNPLLLEYSCQILSEVSFVFLLTLNVWLFAQLHRQMQVAGVRSGLIGLLGVVVGLAALVRASMLYLAVLPFLYFLFERGAWRERVYHMVLYGVGVALIIIPWLLHNRIYYHTWRLTLSGEIHLLHMVADLEGGNLSLTQARRPLFEKAFARMRQDGLDPYRQPFERGRYYRAIVWEYIQAHPVPVLKRVVQGVFNFWTTAGTPRTGATLLKEQGVLSFYFRAYHLIYLLLLGMGIWWMAARREWWWYLCLFLLVALYFTLTAGWAGSARYRLQVFPFSLPVVTMGGAQLLWWSGRLFNRGNGSE